MPTQRPLADMVDDIVEHVKAHEGLIEHNKKLFDIYGGQLQKYVEEALDRTLESAEGRRGAKKRVAPINVLPKVISKLSQVYTEPATRSTDNTTDQELLEHYAKEMHVDRAMAGSNELFNLHKYVGLEPYWDGSRSRLRIIPAHEYIPFSDDPVNPRNPTAIVKFMGTEKERAEGYSDRYDEVNIFYVYSTTEFAVMDSKKRLRTDLMTAVGNPEGINPISRLPIVHVCRDPYRLIPLADSDTLTMTLLIPIMFSNLNYAIEYLCHSITYVTGGEETKNSVIKFLPDSVIELPEGGTIGTISPNVDTEKVLTLIQTYLALWLESKNIKTGGMGATQVATSHVSGIAKIIDEADATQDRKFQTRIFLQAEQEFWGLVAALHNMWAGQALTEDRRLMNPDFDVSIKFGEMKAFVSEAEKIQNLQVKLNSGLISRRRAVRQANPELSDKEIDELLAEIEAERRPVADPDRTPPPNEERERDGQPLV